MGIFTAILVGLSLLGSGVWHGVDRTARTKRGTHDKRTYLLWAGPNSTLVPRGEHCDFTLFAVVGNGDQQRLIWSDAGEQLVDWSWKHAVTLVAQTQRTYLATFIDPVTREEHCREVRLTCADRFGRYLPEGPQEASRCRRHDAYTPKQGKGRLSLNLWAPRIVPLHFTPNGQGYGIVHAAVEIQGAVTEEWYCPRIEWRVYPGRQSDLAVVSSEESDCAPWPPTETPRPRWSRDFTLAEGGWTIEVRLVKMRRTIATKHVYVYVGGRDMNDWVQ